VTVIRAEGKNQTIDTSETGKNKNRHDPENAIYAE
jgi:hypothetical protein